VTLLERDFAAMMGSRFALAVSSCSAALFLSLKALDLPRGAKVLIPAFTFAAVPSAVVHADCVPVLVECGADYRIDMDDFAAKLTDDTAAVLISHMRGHTSDMDRIMAAHELYKKVASGARDDAMAMRYLVPGWTYDPKKPSLGRNT
jgi:dTDP-4-amino-4,6-dideoxygalactose transaminase